MTDLGILAVLREDGGVREELHRLQTENGELAYAIGRCREGETGFRGIMLDAGAARNLYLALGKEFRYLAADATVEKMETSRGKAKSEFAVTDEQIRSMRIAPQPVTATALLNSINAVINAQEMKKLSVTKLNAWLVTQGYLVEKKEPRTINRTVRTVSDSAAEIGIAADIEFDPITGEVIREDILFTPRAQMEIIDHIREISEAR